MRSSVEEVGRGKRVAVFLPALKDGGAERAMLRLASGLRSIGYEVDLVLAQAVGAFMKEAPQNVEIIDLGCARTVTSVGRLARYLRRRKPVAVIAALDRANLVALWARALTRSRSRVAISIQVQVSVNSRNGLYVGERVTPALARSFYRRADAVVAVSQGVADDVLSNLAVPADRVHVIPNPVVSDTLFQAASEPVDHPWFEAGAPPVVLAVGRLQPQKDYPNLLRAFALVRRNRPCRLMILGEGPLRGALTELATELGIEADLALPGFTPNPYAYMSKAAALTLSSGWEGLPTVLIEALACGTPIVSTDCPSGPREILAGGRYGKLVPVGDHTALAEGIEQTLAEGRRPVPEESWKTYELRSVAERFADLVVSA